MRTIERSIHAVLIPIVLLTASSCDNRGAGARPDSQGMVKEYRVMEVRYSSATLHKDYPAMLKGQQTVEIRPKISGYIEQILVDEGARVRKGQLLFKLNVADLEAAVRSVEAQVKVAEADVNSARINLEKTKPLVEKAIISKFELESVESAVQAKEAQLAQFRANLENARVNVRYALITSPTDGTIGTFSYRIGSLVNANITEPLTTVSNTARVHAYFSLNEKDFLSLINGLPGRNVTEKLAALPEVQLIMADNTAYDLPGKIETASGLIDQKTGAVTMRATFPNPEGLLRNGGSGVIRIPRNIDSVILVPQNATYELQGKRFVYTVTPDNKVRNTEIQAIAGNLKDTFVVTGGLDAGDRIVMEGIASLRNDAVIKPVVAAPESLTVNNSAPKPATN